MKLVVVLSPAHPQVRAFSRALRSALGLAALTASLVACRRETGPSATLAADASFSVSTSDGASPARPAVLGARCRATGRAIQLDDGGGLDELDVGDGLADADGYAVGIVHRSAAGRVAAVALLGSGASEARVVDLGPTLGDAPPPRLALCRDQLVAAAFSPPVRSPPQAAAAPYLARDLALYDVGRQGPPAAAIRVAQHGDESLAFDLACSSASGLAVWDETATLAGSGGAASGAAARGVVRGASFQVGQGSAVVTDVSSADSDAEMPRVVRNAAGFLVFWIARRPEAKHVSDGSADIEAIGEARAFGWLEMVPVDITGKTTGPPRRLTSTAGHISAYDVLARSEGDRSEVVVAARDDGESVDGAGGTLVRLRLRSDGADVPSELPTDGLGRGAPAFVDAPLPWLAWVGPNEEMRLLPLDPKGEVAGLASAEPGLDEARFSIALGSGGGSGARAVPGEAAEANTGSILVAAPRDKLAQLRVFECVR